ncbi:histidinol-phosphatase HisJ family protein [Syntrophomonas curvata]
MLQDYHIHALAHGEYRYTYDWLKTFAVAAREQGILELGFSEHDEYLSRIDTAVLQQLREEFPDINIRLGLEVDYIPGREEHIREISRQYDFDYLIGSIHFIEGWGFDHPDFSHLFTGKDIDQIYRSYFNLVHRAIKSGLFDVVGHLDLIKIWGHRPREHTVEHYVEPLLNSIKAADMVIEINSAGLRKPVKEIYPAPEIIDLVFAKEIAVTLGSDAHHPSQLGEGLAEAHRRLIGAGFKSIAMLEQRQVKLMALK